MKQLNNEAIEQTILRTLAYADVFDWPLAKEELPVLSLRGSRSATWLRGRRSNLIILKKLINSKKIGYKDNFYFLFGRKGLVERRLQREKWTGEKMAIARSAAKWLRLIPSILLVGVSGGLAVGNVRQDDDIDFFIICRSGTLWTTRFLSIILLELLGRRRRPGDKEFKDKICPNMFVDEAGMAVPEKERDIYTAHEIRNLKVMWEKEGAYQRFLKANRWTEEKSKVKSQKSKVQVKSTSYQKHNLNSQYSILNTLIESFFCWLQLKYMDKKRTREKIEPHRLLFHPQDKRKWVLRQYQKQLKWLKITTKFTSACELFM